MIQLVPGSSLQNGKYIIKRALGQGGFGITYEADQVNLLSKVAIKEFFMKDCCDRDGSTSHIIVPTQSNRALVEKFKAKFVKEAQMIASMDHPSIVRVTDVFEENDTAYYVMGILPGGSLAEKVKREGRLSETQAESYIRQVAMALDYIHSSNTVHLDVKPSNILLNSKGDAVLIDFGISKHYDESGEQTSSTPVGISKGFAPLEQGRDGDVSQFKPSTDIYALGATFYYLLTGAVPPEASIVNEEGLPHHTGISNRMFNVLEKSMQPRRKDRPQNISEFLDLLKDPSLDGTDESTIVISSPIIVNKAINNNGHEFVDLGLSVKWASCNLGAQKPYEIGSWFSWGETSPKKRFKMSDYSYYRGFWANNSPLEYNMDDQITTLQLCNDAARAKMGGDWRIPTSQEWNELLNECQIKQTLKGTVKGFVFTGPSGNSIFFPCSGFKTADKVCSSDKVCLWSSVLDESNRWYAGVAEIGASLIRIAAYVRYYGLPIRPVIK